LYGEIRAKTLGDVRITPSRRRELSRLAQRPDSEIDFSDIPELDEKFWANAVRNPFHRRDRRAGDERHRGLAAT
jgi:hypothetical protein